LGEPIASVTYAGLVRLDDRLIHGQVLVNWARALVLSRLVVVDDPLSLDERARSVLRAVVPSHISLWVGSVAAVPSALAEFAEPVDRHLVLLPSPLAAVHLYDAGIHYLVLNVACLGSTPDRIRLLPQVSLTPGEFKMLAMLASRGVEIVSQAVPSESIVRWPEIKARATRALPRQVDVL
jgi:mannose/fructose/N-acetylgalactosamine-specific phosphotransferase system component IIB